MKSLSEAIKTNESFIGVAGGVIAGIIGLRIIRGILSAGLEVYISKRLEKDAELLENEWIPELESLLQAHPESYKWAKDYWKKENVSGLLTRIGGTLGAATFVTEVLEHDDWSDEDAERFRTLWDKSIKTSKNVREKLANDLLASIK